VKCVSGKETNPTPATKEVANNKYPTRNPGRGPGTRNQRTKNAETLSQSSREFPACVTRKAVRGTRNSTTSRGLSIGIRAEEADHTSHQQYGRVKPKKGKETLWSHDPRARYRGLLAEHWTHIEPLEDHSSRKLARSCRHLGISARPATSAQSVIDIRMGRREAGRGGGLILGDQKKKKKCQGLSIDCRMGAPSSLRQN